MNTTTDSATRIGGKDEEESHLENFPVFFFFPNGDDVHLITFLAPLAHLTTRTCHGKHEEELDATRFVPRVEMTNSLIRR